MQNVCNVHLIPNSVGIMRFACRCFSDISYTFRTRMMWFRSASKKCGAHHFYRSITLISSSECADHYRVILSSIAFVWYVFDLTCTYALSNLQRLIYFCLDSAPSMSTSLNACGGFSTFAPNYVRPIGQTNRFYYCIVYRRLNMHCRNRFDSSRTIGELVADNINQLAFTPI